MLHVCRLHLEMQKMEKQVVAMCATWQLSEDKLDYDGRVLRERAPENAIALMQQKRRIAQLRDSLSTLKVAVHVPFSMLQQTT